MTDDKDYDANASLAVAGVWSGGSWSSSGATQGWVDEVRVCNEAKYTADFTPPTTEFSSDANTSLLIHSNAAMGYLALPANTTGHCNVALGYNSGPSGAALNNTVALGDNVSATASNSFVLGNTSHVVDIPSCKLTIGGSTGTNGYVLTTNADNTVSWQSVAAASGGVTCSATNNTYAGDDAANSITTAAADNTAFGYKTLYSATSGDYNSAFGTFALYSTTIHAQI